MRLSDLGLVGNCQISALVHRSGAIVWSCLPRFDSPPVFGTLLDERGGSFSITSADGRVGQQRYLTNTNVLETRFDTPDGAFRVLDFAPRFLRGDRSVRPTRLVRVVEPIEGTPRVRVTCDPIRGWSRERPRREQGSHHVAFHGYDAQLRLTTNAPLSYLGGEEAFALTTTRHFVLTWGDPLEEPLEPFCADMLRATVQYWRTWVKHCAIPPLYQQEVIRSALALKLHCFEDTGAIVAAMTTSIPEAPGSGRTWDYRYCWLRDAYYVIGAFRRLGHFEERQHFLDFLLNVAASAPDLELAPLYRVDGRTDLEESIQPEWSGIEGEKPVRVGNAALDQRQHDVFGELVLALTPLFVDARFAEQATTQVLDLVERLARKAALLAGTPDAGIWEVRTVARRQTFSTLMCWAGVDRMARIAERHRPASAAELHATADRIRARILTEAVDPQRKCLVAQHSGHDVDAALLQAVALRFLPPTDPRMHATVDAVRRELEVDGWLRRYRTDDGFGEPRVAFTLCTFWLVEALATLGRIEQARTLMERVRAIDAPLGLLSEDVDPKTGRMWGNFPQAYSHVGLIHAAFAASPTWSEVG